MFPFQASLTSAILGSAASRALLGGMTPHVLLVTPDKGIPLVDESVMVNLRVSNIVRINESSRGIR